jgi:hypothetical protein
MQQTQTVTAEQGQPLTTNKTVLAQAMEGLEMGSRSDYSPDSQQSQPLPDLDDNDNYDELDTFAQLQAEKPEKTSDTSEPESEEMSEQDAEVAAGFFVDTGAGFVESLFDYPVTIDNDTREVIAQKAVPVVLKNAKGVQLPPWVIRYREELELLGVVAMAGLSIYKQIKIAKAEELKAEKETKKSFDETFKVVA